MEIEIGFSNRQARIGVIAAVLLVVVIGLGFLGRVVTPMEADTLVLLTPDRWQAAGLARQAATETVRLQTDGTALYELLNNTNSDPVTAMLLTERIYARHKSGTSATATARHALIDAAAVAARYTAGSATYDEAILALNGAFARIDALLPGQGEHGSEPDTSFWLDPTATLR